MKALILNNSLELHLIPRIYPNNTVNLVLNMRNEMTDEVLTPEIIVYITDLLNITILNTEFKVQDKFEISLFSDGNLIYLGKLIVLKEGTDVQNYEYNTQKNEIFGYRQ